MRLTKVQKVYILNAEEAPDKIAKTLGLKLEDVEKFLAKNKKEEPVITDQKLAEEINPAAMPVDKRFIKTGLASKDGAVIMTKAGSEKGDMQQKTSTKSNRTNCIHRTK